MKKTINKKAPGHAKKVFVGLSGGVDSSVSAALLKEVGYDVTGVFIKVWHPDFLPCNWKEERLDAMRVCAKLEIPFLTLNLEQEYKREVVDYMVAEYKAGRTPNPDVMCNKKVKFGAFFQKAMEAGADYVATGHYARVENTLKGSLLLAGKDSTKDQSYFLWTLGQNELSRTLFPVGHIPKTEVRKLAKKFGLNTAEKKDSQGLCFIGKIDLEDFLAHYIEPKTGKVLNESGEEVGTHRGAFFFTIGQRHGFTITKKGTDDKPLYVISKDVKNNTLVVSPRFTGKKQSSDSAKVIIEKASWTISPPVLGKKYSARIRYRQELESCVVKNLSDGKYEVTFEKPEQAVTAGQSLVLYDKDVCLGGGIIV